MRDFDSFDMATDIIQEVGSYCETGEGINLHYERIIANVMLRLDDVYNMGYKDGAEGR